MPGCRFPLLRPVLTGFLAILLFHPAARSQAVESQTTDSPAATLKINVRTVLVDVVVTDKENRAVPGLHKEDFQLLEDGKPQDISFFESNFEATPEPAAVDGHPLPPNTFTNVPAVPPNNAVNVLLMDALNTPEGDQAYVHKEMVRYIANVPPSVRIGVFLLGEKLRIIQGFTDDSSVLRASIARLAANPTTSALLPTAIETAAMDKPVNIMLQKAADEDSQQLALEAAAFQQFLDQQQFFQTNERTIMTLDALQQIARYLSGVPGRKNLIWFVGAIPQCLAAMTSESELTSGGCPYEEKFAKTMDMLADARVSVYPIDAGGLQTYSLYDSGGPPPTATLGASGSTATAPITSTSPAVSLVMELNQSQQNSILNDSQQRTLAHLQMERLALLTGGKAVYERNSIKDALAKDIENGSHYYTIAYTPSNHREVGKERRIEIRSATGTYKLAYRRGYFEDNPRQQKALEKASLGDPLRPLMDRGMPSFTELRYRMKVAPANPQPAPNAPHAGDNAELSGPCTRYTVNFSLATEGLTLATGPDGVRRGTIEVALVAYSQEGKPLDWEVRSIGIAIKPEQSAVADSTGIPFHFDIDSPPGDVYLRTGIYDASSSRAGTLEIPLSTVTMAQR
jgi:VWFA-related protein